VKTLRHSDIYVPRPSKNAKQNNFYGTEIAYRSITTQSTPTMKTLIAAFIFAAFITAASPICLAAPLARVISATGNVIVDGKPVAKGDTIAAGKKIVTDGTGAALIGLASGQYCFISKDTSAVISELKMGSAGERISTVNVEKGSVNSDIHKPKSGSNQHSIVTPFGELKAKGTAWGTSVGSTLVAVSYSGTVTYSYSGLGSFNLTPGSVATLSGAPSAPELKVVDLVSGKVYTYSPGSAPEERTATVSELKAAAASFEDGISAFLATASESDQLALGELIIEINQTLGRNGIIALGAGKSSVLPPSLVRVLTQLSSLASPESPPAN
jgi:hypothetical protein